VVTKVAKQQLAQARRFDMQLCALCKQHNARAKCVLVCLLCNAPKGRPPRVDLLLSVSLYNDNPAMHARQLSSTAASAGAWEVGIALVQAGIRAHLSGCGLGHVSASRH